MRLEKLVALSIATTVASAITISSIVPQAVQAAAAVLYVRARFAGIVIG